MANKSYLEEKAINARNEQLVRNDYNANKTYENDKSHPELRKETGESNFVAYRPHEKTGSYAQIDTFNGGSKTDIEGNPNVEGGYNGRNYLKNLNLYNENNAYGVDSVEIDTNIEGQIYF